MEIRYNKIILLLFILTITKGFASNDNDYYIKDVCINNVCVKSSSEDYRSFFKGETIMDSIIWNDYEEEYYRQAIYKGDSLYIYMSAYGITELYSKYIELFSSEYEVSFRDMKFRVGMTVEELPLDIQQGYEVYIGKDKKFFTKPAYLGIQLLIETHRPDMPFYPCQGLKFQILEGKIISIMVDFRTDGDF